MLCMCTYDMNGQEAVCAFYVKMCCDYMIHVFTGICIYIYTCAIGTRNYSERCICARTSSICSTSPPGGNQVDGLPPASHP